MKLMNSEQLESLFEILGGLYIQSLRNYDVMCIIADKLGADVIALKNLHEQGFVLAPDPALRLDETDENVDKSQKPSDY
jgi:hypothetical protein